MTEHDDISADLAETVEGLRALPKEATPDRDLWPEIQARIRTEGKSAGPGDVPLGVLTPQSTAWWNRSVSAPWAMAASVVFASAIGMATWQFAQRGEPGQIADATGAVEAGLAGSENVVAVGNESTSDLDLPEYELAVAGLQQAYEAGKDRLAPETVEVLEQSLATIDLAIAEARAAIEADPALDEVRRILYNNLNRKLDVLRQAAEAVQEQA